MTVRRVGLIVPSSNVTVETELPALLRRQEGLDVSFHSSRMRMTAVTPAGLAAMNVQRERCVFGLPVLSAATAGAFSILRALDLPAAIAGAGSLLASGTGLYATTAMAHDVVGTGA